MREIVLDTETTGLDPASGHRIVEIGAVELNNHVPTGKILHRYVNPQREMPAEAFAVHGLSTAFLAEKPVFAEVVADVLEFLGEAQLVIHNAAFDLGFLNAELKSLGFPPIRATRCIDTVEMARRKFPGAPASLDALCRRYMIDLSDRSLHGALKDARLLASVYLELCGGREPGLSLVAMPARRLCGIDASAWVPKLTAPNEAEAAAHEAFLATISDPLWRTREGEPAAVPVKAAG
ncbi:MAG: DNA polymerase III subunit epsilon [Rhodospirillales bacterium]|nr:DNA polymerase III subunit epsilon [Rhodospirillales bacterium]